MTGDTAGSGGGTNALIVDDPKVYGMFFPKSILSLSQKAGLIHLTISFLSVLTEKMDRDHVTLVAGIENWKDGSLNGLAPVKPNKYWNEFVYTLNH